MPSEQKMIERTIDPDFILELYQNYKENPSQEYLEDIKKMVKLMGRKIKYTPMS